MSPLERLSPTLLLRQVAASPPRGSTACKSFQLKAPRCPVHDGARHPAIPHNMLNAVEALGPLSSIGDVTLHIVSIPPAAAAGILLIYLLVVAHE